MHERRGTEPVSTRAFALYAGLLFLFVLAIMLAPCVHRIVHRFHRDETS